MSDFYSFYIKALGLYFFYIAPKSSVIGAEDFINLLRTEDWAYTSLVIKKNKKSAQAI